MGKPKNRVIVSSPLHRDPETDGNDYGCDPDINDRVDDLINELVSIVDGGGFTDGEELIDNIRDGLTAIGSGATDTIVKENVRNALAIPAQEAGLEVDWSRIYGW